MKRVLPFLILLVLIACTPGLPPLIPVETAVYLTLAAEPKTDTPIPTAAIPTVTATLPLAATTQAAILNARAPGSECIPTDTERSKGLVTRVLDGATIEVVIGNDAYQVKYLGLQSPRISLPVEWQGPQAFAANERLVNGQNVILVKDTTSVDPNGSLPRYVLAGEIFVNYELVRQGFAKVVITPPDTACQSTLLAAQAEAQLAVLGVWIPTPIPTATITPTSTITPIPSNTIEPPCDCKRTYTCNNFRRQSDAQACFDYCTKRGYNVGLADQNGNGRVCEGLP